MASEDGVWKPRVRNYELERRKAEMQLQECTDGHPLQAIVVESVSAKKEGSKRKETKTEPVADPLSDVTEVMDPLSLASISDPLSAVLAESSKQESTFGGPKSKEPDEPDITFEPWSSKRTTILATYTTSEKIPITTSFLSNEERQRLETKAAAAVESDKMKHRLEQLDDLEDGGTQETLNLSQQDYVDKIDTMNRSLTGAWQKDQRVLALKITIQCAKLLADTSVIHFYPSKFVLITDILDNFGTRVFDRIHEKSSYTPPNSVKSIPLPKNFSPDQVPDSAKETCRNWFFKIASIRELVPRFYVETAILNCYRFLTNQEFSQALIRLTKMIRGIGDPLVAAYARAYLCRVGQRIECESRNYVMLNYTDYLCTFSQLNSDAVQDILAVQALDMSRYMKLFAPAVEWVLQCLGHRASTRVLEEVLAISKEKTSSGLVLNALLNAFPPDFISNRANEFADMIKDCEESVMPKYLLYVALGNSVVQSDPPAQDQLGLLNSVWKTVMKLKTPSEYIACAQIWIEFVAKHFSKKEINTLLDNIIKHMTEDHAFESHYSQLVSIVNKILPHFKDFASLFSMDKFLPYIDLFQREYVKNEVCMSIVRAFGHQQQEDTNDPLIINAMMYLCRTLHDSINALSLADDRRQVSDLICSFLKKVSFGRDFEQQLSFYVEARSTFSNLEPVLIFLVHSVNWLCMKTRLVVKGNHTRKTSSFVRACVAYCFITIPSFDDILQKINLYLICGRVAVANGALTQGDSFFKSAINCLQEVPQYMDIDHKRQSTEPIVHTLFCNLFSTLLVVPDNPDKEMLFLIRGVLNAIEEYQWLEGSDQKYRVYMSAICMLSAACQDVYIYQIDKVDSNDRLYSGEKKFTNEIVGLIHTLLEVISNHIKTLNSSPEETKRQSKVALGLFARLAVHSDISEPTVGNMVYNIWQIVVKHGHLDTRMQERFRSLVTERKDASSSSCQALLSKLSTPSSALVF